MNLGFHRCTIEQLDTDSLNRCKVLLDGKAVRCRGYEIKQCVDEVPTVKLDLISYGKFDGIAEIQAENTGVDCLCRHMTLEQLKLIIALWNSYHDANYVLADSTGKECAETTKSEKNA